MNLSDMVYKINSKDDLIKFLEQLILDFKNNLDTWENSNLENYLEAMQSWLEDIEGWENNCNIDISKITPWQLIGYILLASKMYE